MSVIRYRNSADEDWKEIIAIKGDKGGPGDTGKGIAAVNIVDGHLMITYSDSTEIDLGNVHGVTPQRGTDYWNLEDVNAIKAYIDDSIPAKTSQLTNDGESGTGKYATQQFVTDSIQAELREYDALVYKGFIAAEFDLPLYGFRTGHTYKIEAPDVFFGKACQIGDLVIANKDCDLYDPAVTYTDPSYVYHNGNYYKLMGNNVKGDDPENGVEWTPYPAMGFWDVLQTSFDGVVASSFSVVTGNLAAFSDETGRVIQDSGVSVSTTIGEDYNSVPVTAAVYEYAQSKPAQVTTGTNITIADNTEYRLTNVSTLSFTYPTGNFECYIRFTTAASGAVTITFPASSYIGSAPTFGNGVTWEVSIKDGIIIAAKVGAGT